MSHETERPLPGSQPACECDVACAIPHLPAIKQRQLGAIVWIIRATADVDRVIGRLDAGGFDSFARAIAAARRIALHGLGREGLQMKGLAMRLHHLGLDAHVVGDMTLPPVGAGDLFLASAGPGDFATVAALAEIRNPLTSLA